jgi:hypothetical protein
VAGEQILIPQIVADEIHRFDLPDAAKQVIAETS